MVHKKISTVALLTTCLYAAHGMQPNTAQPAPYPPVAATPAPAPYAPTTPTTYAPAAPQPAPATLAPRAPQQPMATAAKPLVANPKTSPNTSDISYPRMGVKLLVHIVLTLAASRIMLWWDSSGNKFFDCALVAFIVLFVFYVLNGLGWLAAWLFKPSQKTTPTPTARPATAIPHQHHNPHQHHTPPQYPHWQPQQQQQPQQQGQYRHPQHPVPPRHNAQ